MNFDLFDRTILLTRAGSRAYGIHTPTSDLDVKGVAIPPAEWIIGLQTFEQADKQTHFEDPRIRALLSPEEVEVVKETKLEGTIYEMRKLVKLALDCNPNCLDVLFCRDEDVLHATEAGRLLRASRDLFISAAAKFRFSGYAISQLKRIQLHRRHLLQPPSHKPTRAEFDLPETTLIPQDQLAAAESMVTKQLDSWEMDLSKVPDESDRLNIMAQFRETMTTMIANAKEDEATTRYRAAARTVGIDDNLLAVMERERSYKGKKAEWDNYENWRKTRNPARAALEAKHGYDSKHAGHLYRLLKMCREILTTGKVNVWRGGIDAEEILAIRNGAWTYEQVLEFAETEDKALTEIYNTKKYVVPHRPNSEAVEALVVKLYREALS